MCRGVSLKTRASLETAGRSLRVLARKTLVSVSAIVAVFAGVAC
jgi:hypothetical protein